jgi:hypothetical protein
MGAIVALKADGKVYLATNRMKKRLDFYWRTSSEFNFKIQKLKGGVLVGADGPLIEVQKLYLNESWFTPPKGTPFDKKFIVTSIIPKYIEVLKEYELDAEDEDEDKYPHSHSQFIIVKGDDIFVVTSDYGVFSVKDFVFISAEKERNFYKKLIYSLDKSDPKGFFEELFKKSAEVLSDAVEEYVLIDSEGMEFSLLGGTK